MRFLGCERYSALIYSINLTTGKTFWRETERVICNCASIFIRLLYQLCACYPVCRLFSVHVKQSSYIQRMGSVSRNKKYINNTCLFVWGKEEQGLEHKYAPHVPENFRLGKFSPSGAQMVMCGDSSCAVSTGKRRWSGNSLSSLYKSDSVQDLIGHFYYSRFVLSGEVIQNHH